MRSRFRGLVAAAAFMAVVTTVPARSEHFDMFLHVRSGTGVAESGWDTDPPEGGLHDRQILKVKSGEELSLEWRLRSEFPHGTMKRVAVRLFVAPEAALGQKLLPPPSAPRVINNRFTADFLPQHSARGETRFRVMKPGFYLLRLQSENTLSEHGHEHFAAIDLQVE